MGVNALCPVQETALELDAAAVRLVRGESPLGLAVGETLARLADGDRLLRMGYSRLADYGRERLGMPPRTLFLLLQLARGAATRPLLRRAIAAGALTPRKALAVLPVVDRDERAWVGAALTSSLGALERAVRDGGGIPPPSCEAEALRLAMTEAQQDRLDAALLLAREVVGLGAPRWQCLEALCQEWLGGHGGWAPLEAPARVPAGDPARLGEGLERQLAALAEADAVLEGELPADAEPAALDARLRRLVAAQRGFDTAFGPVALAIAAHRAWRTLGYGGLEEYCRERLGMSPRAFRERAWLERRMRELPGLREALADGRVTYSKALLLAKDATPASLEARIAEAESTTWQQLDREATEREERRNRALGLRRLWGPKESVETVAAAVLSAQRWSEEVRGARIDPGEALALIADHFVEVWEVHRPPRRMSRARWRVLTRHGGLCAVPGCTRPAQHVHHIVFRSRLGPEEPWNEVGVCAPHHLHGIHKGYLTVRGRAGERLTWALGSSRIGAFESWTTLGDDDVRRAPPARRLAPV